jgi:PAS domain S-box-containing protein
MPAAVRIPASVSSLQGDEMLARSAVILEATTDVVAMTDPDGNLHYLNNTGRRLLGLDSDESLHGMTLADLHPGWAYQVVRHEAFPSAMAEGSWSGETALASASGTELPVLQVVLVHHGEDGKVDFLSTICRDITERKQRELERIEWANRYDAAIRASGQVVFDWDTVTDEVTYGGNTGKLLGRAAAEMRGGIDRLRELVHSEDLAEFDKAIENVLATRTPFLHEFRAVATGQEERILGVQGRFFLDRHGRIGRMVGFLRDVTIERTSERSVQLANELLEQRVQERTIELERANRDLAAAAHRQEAVARVGQHALAGVPLDKLMVEAVNAIHEMMPADFAFLHELDKEGATFRCRALAGWPSSADVPSEAPNMDSQCECAIEAGEAVVSAELASEKRFAPSQALRSAGAQSSVSLPIRTGDQCLAVLSVFSREKRDYPAADVNFIQTITNVITAAIERHEAEEEIRSAQAAAELANRAKTEFMSRMSHELRTPLNAVLGFSQLLEMEEHTERQKESITLITRAGRNLLDLINEVLDIARLDAGRVQFNVETVDLLELFRHVVQITSHAAAARNVEVRITEPAGETPFLSVDRERLKQILVNLMSNAVKYNRDGGSVTLSAARASGTKWRVSVSDTGPGIPEDKLSRLFVPFERLGTREGGTEGGTGLGLALCQRLVRALGGRIGVDSTAGAGSTFWVELEAAEVAGKVAEVVNPGLKPPSTGQWTRIRTVLYIEDDPTNYYLLDRILGSRKDVRLASAADGNSALAQIRESPPDLVLLDMNLPDMTGEQVLQRLREDPVTAKVRVVGVTGDVLGDRAKELAALGMNDMLLKPYKVAEIMSLLDRLFSEMA